MHKVARVFCSAWIGTPCWRALRLLALIVMVHVSPLLAQPIQFAVPLTVSDGVTSYTLAFGILQNAHFCVVESDSLNGLAEFFLPPPPPGGVFDARFGWPRTGTNAACFDQGTTYDFRPFTSATERDTFRVKSQLGSGSSMILYWNHRSVHFGQATLRYFDQNLGQNVNVDMLAVDSADVTANGDPATVNIYTFTPLVSVPEQTSPAVPTTFALSQNYPNPFNPSTTIGFAIAQAAKTDITVYDILGRKVATLANELMSPGYYKVQWDGRNNAGTSVASGVYFVRMTSQANNGVNFSAMRKLLLMK